MKAVLKEWDLLFGRIMLAPILLVSGLGKIGGPESTTRYMASKGVLWSI